MGRLKSLLRTFYVYIFLEICLHLQHAMKGAQLMSTHSTLGFTASFHWAVPCFVLIRLIHIILWGYKYWFPHDFSLWHFSLYYANVTKNNHYHIFFKWQVSILSPFYKYIKILKTSLNFGCPLLNISQWLSISGILLCGKTQIMAVSKKKLCDTLMVMALFPCEDI